MDEIARCPLSRSGWRTHFCNVSAISQSSMRPAPLPLTGTRTPAASRTPFSLSAHGLLVSIYAVSDDDSLLLKKYSLRETRTVHDDVWVLVQ